MSHRADLATVTNSITGAAPTSRFAVPEWLEGAGALDVFAAIVAFLLPVAISPVMGSYTFTPKLAVLLVVAAVGLPQLARRCRARDRAAWAAAAFLAVGLASAASSGSVLSGFFGGYLTGTGWVFWCGVVGAWAIGRSTGPRGRELVVAGLVASAVVNALVAIVQQAFQLASPVLGLYQGTQADGLMGNPIFLESIELGALAVVLVRTCSGRWRWSLLALLLSASLELSGERFAIALLALLAAWALVVHRDRFAALFAASLAAGYAVTYGLSSALVHERIAQSVVSNPRPTLWKVLLHAFEHRPLIGFGPGQTLQASTAFESAALARRLPVATYFTDAHDIFVEVAITTGILGILAFAAFGLLALRGASGALLGVAVMAVAVELVEPLNVGVTPIAFLALGAAGAGTALSGGPSRGRARHAATAALTLVALGASAVMLYGDYELNVALLRFDYPVATAGARALAVWADAALVPAEVATNRSVALADGTHWLRLSRYWHSVAVSRNPTDTQMWTGLAGADAELGNLRAATAEYGTALRLDRFATEALVGLARVEAHEGHSTEAVVLLRRALATAPGYRPAHQLLAQLGGTR
ncbi:MAG: O-antigen ligase family protein [Actinomycetota bacterium]|nr:O-antigen ligase family protein [Actinomycetota bacterium]